MKMRCSSGAHQGPGWVYFAQSARTGLVKVGHTRKLHLRFNNLKSAEHANVTLLWKIWSPTRADREKFIHKHLSHYRVRGEWFAIDMGHILAVASLKPRRVEAK